MRYFLKLAYNGTRYHGWQYQPNAISVQEKINDALQKILKAPINIMGAGRTDTGVHASEMFAHFDFDEEIEEDRILYKLNSYLPDDIVLHRIIPVHDKGHARFDAISRSYEYHIIIGRNPFELETTWQYYQNKLDVDAMNQAAKLLLAYTNFKCFSKSKTEVKTYNCKITEAVWELEGQRLVFHISADRFLRNMVRAIVGTLVEVGIGKRTVDDIHRVIASENRSEAGLSVPAKGLFLTKIIYPEELGVNG